MRHQCGGGPCLSSDPTQFYRFTKFKVPTLQNVLINRNCYPPPQIFQAGRKIAKVPALDKLKLKRWKQRDCKASLPYLSKSISSIFVKKSTLPYLSTLISQSQNISSVALLLNKQECLALSIWCIVLVQHDVQHNSICAHWLLLYLCRFCTICAKYA